MSFVNKYTVRRVADASGKGCDICYKTTTTVLFSDSPEGKDFFYVCPAHLKDRKFCSPAVDAEAEKARIEAKHKEEIDAEIEKLKEEYAAKKAKEEGKEGKEKNKDGEKTSSKKDTETENKEKADQKKTSGKEQKRRDLELAKRQYQQSQMNRERMAKADFWPTVPGEIPKK
ncbi:UPF0589 protein C32H8.01c [Ceratocystis fimbriata CBS 114723]|uniref:UPF0589 protein C32H8.01c n=1 Tax=Ceratocystis fimbriata CBS 114723 TaxID=1035309 RepID=A0A2C5XDV9_9PEZI|nr:UPF0589 protein C32H8.01c [Ceratocystis fimbriata CBS 114723]